MPDLIKLAFLKNLALEFLTLCALSGMGSFGLSLIVCSYELTRKQPVLSFLFSTFSKISSHYWHKCCHFMGNFVTDTLSIISDH